MLVQEEMRTNLDNGFFESGLGKLVDGETTKKAAREIVVKRKEEKEDITSKAKLYLRVIIPMFFLFLLAIFIGVTIKLIVGVDKFVEFAKNYVKLMLF